MDYLIESYQHKNHKIEIFYDLSPFNPIQEEHFGTLVCFHSRYDLGDKHNFEGFQELAKWIEKEDAISRDIYMYEHSGIALSTGPFSCNWDSGQIGMIYITKQDAREWYNWKRITKERYHRVREALRGTVSHYGAFLNGEVYGYRVSNPSGEFIESCWGYIDALDVCKKDAEDTIERLQKELVNE